MISRRSIPAPGLTLRAAGVVLLLVGAGAIHVLMRVAARPPVHPASPVELALATIGFLGSSAGAALTILGGHVLDRVYVAAPWRSYRQGRRDRG